MTGPLLAIAVVLLAAALIRLVVPRIMERVGVSAAQPDERSAGFNDVLTRLRARQGRKHRSD